MAYDRTLWHHLIHVANALSGIKLGCCCCCKIRAATKNFKFLLVYMVIA
jgi:hypothetical protein